MSVYEQDDLRSSYSQKEGQVENWEIPETTEITEKAVKQGNYKFCQ